MTCRIGFLERRKEAVMSMQPEQPKKRTGVTGLAIPAGLFIGLGVGLVVDNTSAGVLLGLGGGFVGMIVLRIVLGDW
jgi:hypothetical protein